MTLFENIMIFSVGWVSMRIIVLNDLAPKKFVLKTILTLLVSWSLIFSNILSYLLTKELEYEREVVEMTRDEIFEHKERMDAIYNDYEDKEEELRDAYVEIQALKAIIATNDTEKCHMDSCKQWTCHSYTNNQNSDDHKSGGNTVDHSSKSASYYKKNVGHMFGWMSSSTTSLIKSFFGSSEALDYDPVSDDFQKKVCPYKSKEDAISALLRHLRVVLKGKHPAFESISSPN